MTKMWQYVDFMEMENCAHQIAVAIRDHFPQEQEKERQIIALGEEVGEFLGAARRYLGMARRTGTYAEMEEELADVIITAFVTAEVLGIPQMTNVVQRKLQKIFTRGWKDER